MIDRSAREGIERRRWRARGMGWLIANFWRQREGAPPHSLVLGGSNRWAANGSLNTFLLASEAARE